MNSLLRSFDYLLAFTAACGVVQVVGVNPPNANAEAFAQGRI
jgi:hypothetical protein